MKTIEPREYQLRIIEKTIKAFTQESHKSVLIESPTGSGKTIIALSTLKRLQELIPDITFGWVAMRQKLLIQAAKENENIGVNNIQYISMFDKNPPQCKFMITDEAQHDAADTCISMHGRMGAQFSLGLTATPFRTDRIKLTYEKIITDCGVRFLIEAGYLANFDQYVIKDWSPQIVGQTFLADQERWGKSIFYFKNTQLCFELEKILKDAGVPCAVLLGSLNTSVKDKIYSDFENGTIKALINVYLLTEGFDAPDLKTVWVRDSGKLCTMQMAGRVLRKCPEWLDKVANIIQPENTPYPYARTAKPRKQYVWDEGSWKSIEAGPQVERMTSIVTRVIMPMQVILPKFLDTNGTTISINRKSGIKVKNREAVKKWQNWEVLKKEG